jgi:hypothetical protein
MLPLLSDGRMYPELYQPSVSLGVIQYENALPQTSVLAPESTTPTYSADRAARAVMGGHVRTPWHERQGATI